MLQTKDLTIGYQQGKKQTNLIQQDINLQIKPQTLTTLLGINGIGKSTLIRTLTGQIPPLRGTITLNERDLMSYSTQERAKEISVVLTDPIPYSNLSVLEVLQIGRTPFMDWKSTHTTEDQYWIEKAIDLTSIAPFIQRPITHLSDGQLQRVFIARALVQNTPLIILDEPASHLDLNHKVKLYQLLKNLTEKENKTILFSSHDIELALQFADEALVLQANGHMQNTIENLISNGVFDHFFQDDILLFDRQTKRFTLAL
ncbi:ABC transporter ATP-binding protein [Myroides sp. 1354]|uniref:ABC transporter ATP-binding protein n=1 Tax=unclassified Myroides TaxID=2642485 RepID=UPI002577C2A0|nr:MULTISPECIES: ABC transporter ATP-binding protein [unclassified Myroides]MDM1045754.1 ABC transporter ATP-binding protein [Myroides sp. R163-1]MDM1056756.1 ABC transporter ATP-binding protein [Myroides sp. 1354]MDM1070549.1 ABC transporter ATP-binding protein [Myroides sp. 1372]